MREKGRVSGKGWLKKAGGWVLRLRIDVVARAFTVERLAPCDRSTNKGKGSAGYNAPPYWIVVSEGVCVWTVYVDMEFKTV